MRDILLSNRGTGFPGAPHSPSVKVGAGGRSDCGAERLRELVVRKRDPVVA